MIRPKLLTVGGDTSIYIGEVEFLVPGSYTFKVPLSVTRIHVCCVGAGASNANAAGDMKFAGGGGGGLAWKNNIEVAPGEDVSVVVGGVAGEGLMMRGDSYITTANGVELIGKSPQPGDYMAGGGWVADGGGGGNGGYGSILEKRDGFIGSYGSGGGAGGYFGDGGSGATRYGVQGGQGGASSGGASEIEVGRYNCPGGRGGGTGIKGVGASGASVRPNDVPVGENAPLRTGIGGSGGTGAGAGSAGGGNSAGSGAVRIIWGNKFSYPSNADVIE